MIVGFQLIEEKTGKVVRQWGGNYGSCPDQPNPIILPNGDHLHGARLDTDYNGYKLIAWEMEAPPPDKENVNLERDLRIERGFPYMEKQIQFRPEDRENVNGASSLAIIAIMNGAIAGDYLWHGGKEPFSWITLDNSLLKLDAFETIGMGKAAAEWKSRHIFAARELKNQVPIPLDFTDNKYWPT